MAAVHKRSIRNYLLDSKLQLRYAMAMVMLSSLLTAGLGYIWYRQMRETSMTVEVKALASMDVDDDEIQQLRGEMKSQDNLRLLALVGFGVLFALVMLGYGIVLTHKIAGPLFKVGRYMTDVKEGKLGPVYNLRKGDQLQEFFEVYKGMHNALRERQREELALLTKVVETTESQLARAKEAGVLLEMEQPLTALRELRDKKQTSLGQEG